MNVLKDLGYYTGAAIRTESPYVEAPLDFKTYRLLHGAMGVMTEAGELFDALNSETEPDVVNINEEIGDCCWYTALLCDVLGQRFEHLVLNTYQCNHGPTADDHSKVVSAFKKECLGRAAFRLVSGAGVILDQCKRKIYYRTKKVDGVAVPVPYEIDIPKCEQALQQIVIGVVYTSRSGFGESIETICAKNILKLAKRYPDKFSEAAAIERDLEAERVILEARVDDIVKNKEDTQ